MLQIDLHNLHGQSDFHFPIFCLKDLRLSQCFIVSGTIDHIFQGVQDMVSVKYLTELGFLFLKNASFSKIIRDSLIDFKYVIHNTRC